MDLEEKFYCCWPFVMMIIIVIAVVTLRMCRYLCCSAAADRIRPLLCVCVCMLLMAGRWVPVIVVLCVGGVLSWSPPLLGGCLG